MQRQAIHAKIRPLSHIHKFFLYLGKGVGLAGNFWGRGGRSREGDWGRSGNRQGREGTVHHCRGGEEGLGGKGILFIYLILY